MFKKISIIGCGQIGSSILRDIKKKKISKKISVFDASSSVRKKIKTLKLAGKVEKNLKSTVFGSDFVILCSPVSSYKLIINSIRKSLKKNSILIDVGSVKTGVVKSIEKAINKDVSWIPCHPICGAELSGPENGKQNLFKKKWCILTPSIKSKKKDIRIVKKFWIKLGSNIKVMNIKEHDRIFSITSHLPHLIAYNLVKTAMNLESRNKSNIIQFSGGGLRDFSRIAASNEIMWRDIFISNKKNLTKNIDNFIKNLNKMKKYIKNKKGSNLKNILNKTKIVRKKIILAKQDISKPDFGR